MAATTAQLEARYDLLDEAITSGILTVHNPDGKSVTYRDQRSMVQALAGLGRRLGRTTRPRTILAQQAR